MRRAIVTGAFDDLRFADFRLLEEAAKLGSLHVQAWSDEVFTAVAGDPPRFPLAERQYLLQAIRYVDSIGVIHDLDDLHALPADAGPADLCVVREAADRSRKRDRAATQGVPYHVISDVVLKEVPPPQAVSENPKSERKKVVVTGCYDWLHSGHVRFFEECSELGDLYVVVGHDANIRLLKGEGHPLFPAKHRRYMASSIRYCKMALISTGDGWMDAEPEFLKIKPDIYAVNEDGDKPEKRQFCDKHGIEYRVLKRLPKPGLPRRESTKLRGF